MNEKIDLTEILKYCPVGWELYSSVLGEVSFKEITDNKDYPITVDCENWGSESFTAEGKLYIKDNGECILFPSKEQKDWNKFTAPWYKEDKLIKPKFDVDDWVVSIRSGGTYQVEKIENYEYTLKNIVGSSLRLPFSNEELIREWTINDAKDGDVVQLGQVIAIFKKYIGEEKCICYCSFSKNGGFEIPTKNGKHNVYGCHNAAPAIRKYRDYLMKAMNDAGYEWDGEDKDFKKLVPNRFDPDTLQPFDKVLARDSYSQDWTCGLFSHVFVFNNMYKYNVAEVLYKMCIPYNDDTKHLVGTTSDAPEYYRYWED